MDKQTAFQINFVHVNPKVAEAFAFLAKSLGVGIEVIPPKETDIQITEETK